MNLEEYFKRLHRLAEQQKNQRNKDLDKKSDNLGDDYLHLAPSIDSS